MSDLNKEEKRETIAAVVVTYNRKELLIECLDALMNQTYPLEAIYIIDNASTDGTAENLLEKGFIAKPLYPDQIPLEEIKTLPLLKFPEKTVDIHYVSMHENTGGAGGFHEGVKKAYKGYDWLWLMDDDVLPYENALEGLINEVLMQSGRVIVPSTVIDIEHSKKSKSGLLFAGGLLSCEVFNTIGLPRPEFFIYFDDIEFMWRMNNANIETIQSKEGSVKHADWTSQPKKRKKIFWRIITRPIIPHWKLYYYTRNNIYMSLIYKKYWRAIYLSTFQNIRLILGNMLLNSYSEIPFIIRGTFDGIFRKMGKRL